MEDNPKSMNIYIWIYILYNIYMHTYIIGTYFYILCVCVWNCEHKSNFLTLNIHPGFIYKKGPSPNQSFLKRICEKQSNASRSLTLCTFQGSSKTLATRYTDVEVGSYSNNAGPFQGFLPFFLFFLKPSSRLKTA